MKHMIWQTSVLCRVCSHASEELIPLREGCCECMFPSAAASREVREAMGEKRTKDTCEWYFNALLF